MKNTIELELKAVDFKDTRYADSCNCAISKAIKRQTGAKWANEGVNNVYIDDYRYMHELYGDEEYNSDKLKSVRNNFDNTIIRTIILTKV